MRDAARRPYRLVPAALLALAGTLSLAPAARAQWKWVGPGGVTQYSDQPPPPGTPLHDILARPIPPSVPASTPASAPGASSPAAQAVRKGLLLQQKARQEQRKAQEQAQKLQAEVQDAQRRQLCEQAQQQLQALDSGRRVRQLDAHGAPVYLDSAQIQAQRQQAQAQAAAACR